MRLGAPIITILIPKPWLNGFITVEAIIVAAQFVGLIVGLIGEPIMVMVITDPIIEPITGHIAMAITAVMAITVARIMDTIAGSRVESPADTIVAGFNRARAAWALTDRMGGAR